MNFAAGKPRPANAGAPSRLLAPALLGCCALAVLAAAFPWTLVRFASLWGEVTGPVAMRTDAGFTCVMTCLLTALLVLSEGRSRQAREAVRTGCMLMMALAGLVLAWQLWRGPGDLRGVTARHSGWFFSAAAAVASGIVLCRLRLQRPRPAASPAGDGDGAG